VELADDIDHPKMINEKIPISPILIFVNEAMAFFWGRLSAQNTHNSFQ
jgi:hypothetical protein